jgi:hypothetical protein
MAKDQAATPAEKATARRLAKALAERSASALAGAGANPTVLPCLSHQRQGGGAYG